MYNSVLYRGLSCWFRNYLLFPDYVRLRFIIHCFGSRPCFRLHLSNRVVPVVRARQWPRIVRKGRFTHTMPFPCRDPATSLPFSDSAVSFVKVRVLDGNIRITSSTVSPRSWQTLLGFTLATSIWDWYASDNNLPGTTRGSRKKPNAGRSPTCRFWTTDANSHIPCRSHVVPLSWPWEVAFRTTYSCHGRGTAWYVWIKHGRSV
jgi:hypothetical protein